MTEAEWLECRNPLLMLECIEHRASPRKLLLFAVACYRRIWHCLDHSEDRRLVEVMEAYLEGLVPREEVDLSPRHLAKGLCYLPARRAAWNTALITSIEVHVRESTLRTRAGQYEVHDTRSREEAVQCQLLRDIFFQPFRPVPYYRSWFRWNHGTGSQLARDVYEDRRFQDMPILADALEEAGCTNTDILDHLRSPGPHVRGCWPLDLILGRA
jgi:hypothetical protein